MLKYKKVTLSLYASLWGKKKKKKNNHSTLGCTQSLERPHWTKCFMGKHIGLTGYSQSEFSYWKYAASWRGNRPSLHFIEIFFFFVEFTTEVSVNQKPWGHLRSSRLKHLHNTFSSDSFSSAETLQTPFQVGCPLIKTLEHSFKGLRPLELMSYTPPKITRSRNISERRHCM